MLSGPEGQAWCDAARAIDRSPKVKSYRVVADGELAPEHVEFCALYGISPAGAVLVRPDGHVAFRASEVAVDPTLTLVRALDQTLQRRL